MVQRVDKRTHQEDNTLDMLVDGNGSGITSNIRVVDPGLSDHFLLMSDINARRPKPEVQRFSFRNFHSVDPVDFAANLKMTDVYINPSDDVDSFCSQIQSSVTAVLDGLAPIKSRKHSSRWFSDAAIAAKRT